ncbi:unnamed protein product [Nippostrongylus brasiliensis]|uniref:Transmembrane protein 17 (inferred by orthology to a human protein) n=1 Tax=Nippostrongylus brasiliensis TaxID=27835 RepID=A0A0N4XVR1_NIPBR|nr:unnamed protein product [Nippostrongylus brasiliensis]
MAVHLNICFAPFLFIAEVSCLVLKYSYLSVTYKVTLIAVLLVYILVEGIRLFLAVVGNLGEKIPAISGFWTLSLILQLPIVVFLLLNPAVVPLPFEITMLSIHLLFLLIEIGASFLAMKTMSAQQIRLFKMMIEESER